jgi:flagellar hook-associated protein 1 FlgK
VSNASVLNVALSGLSVASRAMTTIGHNIANVNTEGYSRQRVDIGTRPPQISGGSFLGTGVESSNTRRLYDAFATSRLRVSTTSAGQADLYHELTQALDNLLADADTGLLGPLQDFFNAAQDLANDPGSVAARQALLAEAEGLASRFRVLDRAMADLERGVSQRIADGIAEANGYIEAIAAVNGDILASRGQAVGVQPNDLLDRRDELVRQLATKVGVTVTDQDDGTVAVSTGSGQVLVAGTWRGELVATPSAYDASRPNVGYRVGDQVVDISEQLTGGELKALVQFRGQVLDRARNTLGQVAAGLADAFNQQHALGVDLEGSLGGGFFLAVDETAGQVLAHRDNATPPADVRVRVADSTRLGTSDYRLERTGTDYTLTRLSDGESFTLAGLPPGPVQVASEGLELRVEGAVTIADGDRFLIRPTRLAAREFGLALSDPARVAAAGPLTATSALTNQGGARLQPVVSDTAALPLGASVTLTYDASNGRIDAGALGTVAYDPATYAGETLSVGGLSFTVQGVPEDGDVFTLADNIGGVGDNRNALALGNLRTEPLLGGGRATYEEAYGGLVVHVGTVTRQAEINRAAQQTLLDEATRAREAVSGVNLDEEAADLLRFQQHYQANAQVIAAANLLFDSLLSAIAR